jgi:P pilus assembly chaperone PapD
MMKISLFLVGLLFLSNGYALGVSPTVIQMDNTASGASGMITIVNTENFDVQVKMEATSFDYDESGYKALESSPNDLSSYLIYSPKLLTLKPHESRKVRFNARFLPSTAAGEYRAMIFAQQLAGDSNATSATSIIPRIGTAVYVRVGDVKAELAVQAARYKDKKLVIVVVNTGKATARPAVEWTIAQNSRTIATNQGDFLALHPITVIAEGNRNIVISAPELDKLAAGSYLISGTLLWGDDNENKLKFEQPFEVTQ